MSITINLDTIILFVQDVERLKVFYADVFNMEIIEDKRAYWALLKAGAAHIGLHRTGNAYVKQNTVTGNKSNTKIVFEVSQDIHKTREQLINRGVAMRIIEVFDGYDYLLCDGQDPEGNMFQLKQKK